jgi:predicted phosphoribosyltransferase
MLFREEDEDLEVLPFADRAEAGHLLASKLAAYSHRRDVVVLGPPRGGVTVAFGVASALDVALDVLVLSKIGIPWNQELAMGAVAEHGVQVFDLSIAKQLCISETEIQEAAAIARDELQSREKLYRSGRLPVELAGKTVVLVDDGIATGCTILVAIAAVNDRRPREWWWPFQLLHFMGVARSEWKQTKSSRRLSRKYCLRFRNFTWTSARSAMKTCNAG